MDHDQLEKISGIVDVLLGLPRARRAEALQTLCPAPEDQNVRDEVERLLDEDAGLEQQLAGLHRREIAETTFGPMFSVSVDPSQSEPPLVIGRYHLKKRLGGGGMGEVFLAEQRASIKQTVAIKLIKPGFDSKEVIARFNAERQALARMDHPNIARVLDAGVTDTARPYFVMEYVPGKPITQFADEQRLSIRQRLELFVEVCEAIAHAHTKGVIHRDLKPSNVLTFAVEGKPRVKVIDFGIAKALDGDRLSDATYMTGIGMVLGTYEYMSPEQAAGSPDVDTRSDVYSLGVLLYELLVGVRPFERDELARRADDELRRVIREVEPPRPSTRVRSLTRLKHRGSVDSASGRSSNGEPETVTTTHFEAIAAARIIEPRMLIRLLARELEWIPLKALRKESSRRYASPSEMAADVRNYLQGLPLSAAPESRSYRLRKFVVRHGVSLAVGAIVLGLLVAGVIGTSIGFLRESQARRLADENGRRATWSAYRSAIAAADAARRAGDGVRLKWALDAAPQSLRGWEWKTLARSDAVRISELNRSRSERFVSTTLLPDSRRAWSITAKEDSAGSACVLWDLSTGQEIRRQDGLAIAVDPTGQCYAVLRADGSIVCSDVATGAQRWTAAADSGRSWNLTRNAFALDGSVMAVWDGADPSLVLLDARTGASRRLALNSPPTRVLGFLDVGQKTATGDLVFYLASILSPLRMDVATGVASRRFGIDYELDRQAIAGTAENQFRTLAEPDKPYAIPSRGFKFYRTVLLPQRNGLAYGRDNGSIAVMTATRPGGNTQSYELIVGASPVVELAVTADEQWLVATLQDGSVHVIEIDEPAQVTVRFQGIRDMAVSADGTKVASLGWGDLLCTDVASGMPLWARNLGPHDNMHVAWSADAKTIAVAAPLPRAGDAPAMCDVFVLDGESGKQIAAWSASAVERDPARPAAPPEWSRDLSGLSFVSADLCVAHTDGSITRIDPTSWAARSAAKSQPIATKPVTLYGGLLASPDGSRWIQKVTASDSRPASAAGGFVIRETATDAIVKTFQFDDYQPSNAAWSHDGRCIVASFFRRGGSMLVCIDAETGAERFRFLSTSEELRAIALTRDGGRIIAFARPPAMIVIDAQTGEEILTATQPSLAIAAAFTPGDALLVGGGESGLNCIDGPNVEGNLQLVQDRWPEGCAKPQSVADARRQVKRAVDALMASFDAGQALEQTPQFGEAGEPEQNLARAFARRRPPNINLMNSGGLSMMLISHPLPEELARGVRMLKTAVEIKPHSASLQRNYGTILYQADQFEECIEPLKESIRLTALRGAPVPPAVLLRVAIASKRGQRPDAQALYQQAVDEATRQRLNSDPEIRPLLEQARREFGE